MLKDEFCTTQGSACIIFMGADFWAARIYEGWGRGNAKTGCGFSPAPPLPIIRKRITPAPCRRTAKGGGLARQAVIFFFLPKPLYIRHVQRRVKNILKIFWAVQKYRTTLCLPLHCQKENILTGRVMKKLFLRVGQRFF